MLSRLGIGLDRNEANLNPRLCTVSIIFRLKCLDLKKRKEPYSSLDRMSDVYICLRDIKFAPQEVWERVLRIFILNMVAHRRSFMCRFQVFLRSNVIPRILIDFEV